MMCMRELRGIDVCFAENAPNLSYAGARSPASHTFGNAAPKTNRPADGRSVAATGTLDLFGGAAGGHDLVGRLAGQFRHVVELEGEAADAGRRRANLDDEVADF